MLALAVRCCAAGQMQVDLITEWVDVVRCNDMFERVREVVSLRRMT